MSRFLISAVLLLLPGAAMAQYYPYQQQPIQNSWQPPDPYRFTPQYRPQTQQCTTVYTGGFAGSAVIGHTTCR